jgi:hypothetical protein
MSRIKKNVRVVVIQTVSRALEIARASGWRASPPR